MAKIFIDLSSLDNFNDEEPGGYKNSLKSPSPVMFGASLEDTADANKIVIGEVEVLNIDLEGKVDAIFLDSENEEDPFLEFFYKKVEITINEEAVGLIPEDARIRFSMRSDLFQNDNHIEDDMDEDDMDEDEMDGDDESDEDELNQPTEFICSMLIPIIDDDGQPQEFEYFILPDSKKGDAVYPTSIDDEGHPRWHFVHDRESIPHDKKSAKKGGALRFIFRIFRLNFLRKRAKKTYNRLKRKHKEWSDDMAMDETIARLKKRKKVAREIESSYAINLYRPNNNNEVPFTEVKNIDEINLKLKTLILVPGTFKKSIIKKNDKWQGSFKFLMYKTGLQENWFEFLLENSDFDQIISLEHNSVFDSLDDNLRFFISRLGLGKLRFDQPTIVISASRGGFLAKMLARVGEGKDDQFSKKDLNLNIERIITVANGFTGYLDPSKKDLVKRKIEVLFNIANLLTLGKLIPLRGLLSFTPDFIMRLPGLMGQVRESKDIERLFSKELETWCLPLANRSTMPKYYFVEKEFVDPLLGFENDFVLSFESQKEAWPCRLMPDFDPIIGEYPHGLGLSNHELRVEILKFLKAPIPLPNVPDMASAPDTA